MGLDCSGVVYYSQYAICLFWWRRLIVAILVNLLRCPTIKFYSLYNQSAHKIISWATRISTKIPTIAELVFTKINTFIMEIEKEGDPKVELFANLEGVERGNALIEKLRDLLPEEEIPDTAWAYGENGEVVAVEYLVNLTMAVAMEGGAGRRSPFSVI